MDTKTFNRMTQGMTVPEIMEALSMSRRTIQRYRSGKRECQHTEELLRQDLSIWCERKNNG
jgi:transcriptional regulator with XRE-family HTH domain